MVISPRSKIVTLSLLIGIITLVALLITGVISLWDEEVETSTGSPNSKMHSGRLQQLTAYSANKHVSVDICSNIIVWFLID